MSRPPRYPMPPQQRDETEMVLRRISDREARDEIRRLVARTYAAGFDDGDLYGQTIAWNDRRDECDAANESEETP